MALRRTDDHDPPAPSSSDCLSDTITFATGTVISLTQAVPNITAGVTVQGNGSTIDANGYKAMYLDNTGADFSVSGLTINGATHGFLARATNVTLDQVHATASTTHGANMQITEDGSLTIRDSSFTDNGSQGMHIVNGDGVTVTIERVVSSGNGSHGLWMPQGAEIGTVLDTTLSDNEGWGIGGDEFPGSLTVDSSTVSGNVGHGIRIRFTAMGDIDIVNSTIAQNLLEGSGVSAVSLQTPGTNLGPTATVRYSTVTENGGDIALLGTRVPVSIEHSIVAGNASAVADIDATAAALDADWSILGSFYEPPVISSELEAAAYTEGVGVTYATSFAELGLGALGDNGGLTETYLPLDGSPAIDMGDPALTGEPALDQRDETRVVGDAIDIGSVEVQPAVVEEEEELAATGADPALPLGLAALAFLMGAVLLTARSLRHQHR